MVRRSLAILGSITVLLTALSSDAGWAAPAANHTIVLQQGLTGYTGVRDTWVSDLDWDTPPQYAANYGTNESLMLDRDGGQNPLLRFDVTGIPANSEIVSATLSLYNNTPSCYGGCTDPYVRRVKLYTVLQDWDEGNQVNSPIDEAGKHGATGEHAFDYFAGEGTDVAWQARGMAAGTDYAAAEKSQADIISQGWYHWDVTSLVRDWVRGEAPNFGMVLRDATGWEDRNTDWREFFSSQHASDPSRRPKLTVTYNPDVPFADAGTDQENLHWTGAATALDGSASHDRPGGNDATLSYEWRIQTAAYDSVLSGVIGRNAALNFTPDRAGEWTFALAVTNAVGERATDAVHVRLLSIPLTHPRIYLTPARLAELRSRAVPSNPRWTALLAAANGGEGMLQEALVSQVTGDAGYCVAALAEAQTWVNTDRSCASCPGDVALVFDWCYGQMSAAQKTSTIAYLNNRGDKPSYGNDPGWGNYWPRHGYSYALTGLATLGDNPRAEEWLDYYRYDHHRDLAVPLLERIAAGGAWPEGTVYDWIANWPRVKAVAAWESVTGERLFDSSTWFRERIGYALLLSWPGAAQEWGRVYHPYGSIGDGERNRGAIANYGRIMALILLQRYPDHPLAPQLQAYLAVEPDGGSDDFLAHEEFLWYDPALPTAAPGTLTHYAEGTGTLIMRSAWLDGSADADPSPTHIRFQAGDHFTYHQHWDQNSFSLYKYQELALDSGVYSGDGLSYHDRNYYVRTIAHNTLVVYNPAEDLSDARPDATSNDGGQRSVAPATRSPETIEYFDQHSTQYDTGDMRHFEDTPRYTYALGDATKAYNNPTYNQAMEGLTGNTAKVTRFQREFVYLRPEVGDTAQRDYLVLFDRVGVTAAAFSGANTKLLFHTFDEPTINGSGVAISPGETLYAGSDQVTATHGGGKLFIQTLLPETVNLRKVGGRGQKAYWVSDANYDWHWDAGEPQPRPVSDFEDVPYGEWRVELEPADTALAHNFLTVLHPAASTVTVMPAATVVQGPGLSGVHIADPTLNRVALFSAAADGAPPAGALTYSYLPTANTLNLLVDLTPAARYRLAASLSGGALTVTWTTDAGGAYQVSSQGTLSVVLDVNGVPVGHAVAPDIYLPLIRAGAELNWTAAASNCSYDVYRSQVPYFTPGAASLLAPALPAGTATYTDLAAHIGNPTIEDYYLVRGHGCDDLTTADSERVGYLDFALNR